MDGLRDTVAGELTDIAAGFERACGRAEDASSRRDLAACERQRALASMALDAASMRMQELRGRHRALIASDPALAALERRYEELRSYLLEDIGAILDRERALRVAEELGDGRA